MLLIAELSASFRHTYLNGTRQRAPVGTKFCYYLVILSGVPQMPILGPILFIIFKAFLFSQSRQMIMARFLSQKEF